MSKKEKDLEKAIEKNKGKNHEETVKAMIDYGEYLRANSLYKEACEKYEEAKQYLMDNLPVEHVKQLELEYLIDRGLLSGFEKDTISDPLNQFVVKYDSANLGIKNKQTFCHTVANYLISIDKFDQASVYLRQAEKLLGKFSRKDDDYKIRQVSIYGLQIEIAMHEKNRPKIMKYLEKSISCKKTLVGDPNLKFFFKSVERKHCPRSERMEISKKMFNIWNKFKNSRMKEEKFDLFKSFFEDYMYEKNFEKAEESLWQIFKDEKCQKFDEKGLAKKNLIALFKLPKRLEEVQSLEDSSNFEKLVQIYKKIADEFYAIPGYENAYDYYVKMLQTAKKLPEKDDDSNEKLVMSALDQLIFCLGEFDCCQKEYEEMLQYLQEFYSLQQKFKAPEEALIQNKLDQAIYKTWCDKFTYEEKMQSLVNVKKKLKSDIQKLEYYSAFLSLLENNKEEADEKRLRRVKKKFHIYKEKTKDYKQPLKILTAAQYSEEFDDMNDDEILEAVKEKWIKFDEIDGFKRKMNYIDIYGRTPLHQAIESNSDLSHIKFLIEECGYDKIIDTPDNAGKSPIYFAVMAGENGIIEYLIEKGADIIASTNDRLSVNPPFGTTPMMEAVYQRNCGIVRLLLDKNANPHLKDANGNTARNLLKELIKIGNTQKLNRSGPKHFKMAKPISEEQLEEFKETSKLLREAESRLL